MYLFHIILSKRAENHTFQTGDAFGCIQKFISRKARFPYVPFESFHGTNLPANLAIATLRLRRNMLNRFQGSIGENSTHA